MTKTILSNKGKILDFIVVLILVFGGGILRLLPHPPNFAPVAAMALFGGVYFSSKKLGLALPILAMLISDIFIGFYYPLLMLSVYGSFLLCGILGIWLKKQKKWYTVLGSSLSCSALFFIITNFGVWAFTPWYPKTLLGLADCYIMAIPFFKNTLLGDLFYVTILFGVYEMVNLWIRNKFSISQPTLAHKLEL